MTGNRLVVGTVDRPATVHNVHGAAGRTGWACLARGNRLAGPWEAVEWATVPPGGVSGEHLHTRTEEIYLVISGVAEVRLNGQPHRLTRGGMALTRVGTSHALRNVGTDPVEWLVIEMSSPPTALALDGHDRERRDNMDSAKESMVVDLGEVGEFDPRRVFDGPLESVRLERVGPGRAVELTSAGCEHVVFVVAGGGTAVGDGLRFPLSAGTSVTIPLGGRLRIEPAPDGIEIFRATMRVSGTEEP